MLTLAAAAVLAWGALVWAYAGALLGPARMTDGKAMSLLGRLTPADLGWAYRREDVPGEDGPMVPFWVVPGEGGPMAVLVHGYGDAKVGALAWGPVFRGLGCGLALPDMRGHGESRVAWMTAGVREADDLARLLERLAEGGEGGVVLFGASLGGAAVARVMSDEGYAAETRRVIGVVLDSPPATFAAGVRAHGGLVGAPGAWVTTPARWVAGWRAGVRLADADIAGNVARLRCPALVVLPRGDAFIPPGDRERLRAAARALAARHPETRVWEPEGGHLLAVRGDPEGYAREVAALLGGKSGRELHG